MSEQSCICESKRTVHCRIVWETVLGKIIVAVIAGLASVAVAFIGYAASTYESRHADVDDVSIGETTDLKFYSSSSAATEEFKINPCTGTLYVSAKQTSGTSSMKYSFYYKKYSTSSSWTTIKSSLKFSKNGVYSDSYEAGKVKKNTQYLCKVVKTAGYKTYSRLYVDWMID